MRRPRPTPSPESEVVRQLFGYAPGVGVLEEETIDEDEYDFEPIAGQHDEHPGDELEEETLDQAATIEDAVRDEHVEKRLASSTPEEAGEDEETDDFQTGFAETRRERRPGDEEFEEARKPRKAVKRLQGNRPQPAGAPARREDRRIRAPRRTRTPAAGPPPRTDAAPTCRPRTCPSSANC